MTDCETPQERQLERGEKALEEALDDFAAGRPILAEDDVPILVWAAGDSEPSLEAQLFALRLDPPEWDTLFVDGNYGEDEEVGWLRAEILGVLVRSLFTEEQFQTLGSKCQRQLAVAPWALARMRRYADLCIELGQLRDCSQAFLGGEGAPVVDRRGDGSATAVLASEFGEYSAAISNDGKWLAYVSNRSGPDEVMGAPVSRAGRRSCGLGRWWPRPRVES